MSTSTAAFDGMASAAVTLVAKYKVKDSAMADLQTLVAQFVSKVQENEQETCLQYTWSVQQQTSDEGDYKIVCCQESFVSVPAVLQHLENVGSLFAPFLALVEIQSSEVYANSASTLAELRESPIDQWKPTYFEVFDLVQTKAVTK